MTLNTVEAKLMSRNPGPISNNPYMPRYTKMKRENMSKSHTRFSFGFALVHATLWPSLSPLSLWHQRTTVLLLQEKGEMDQKGKFG